jgi:hypothetical protein
MLIHQKFGIPILEVVLFHYGVELTTGKAPMALA